MSKAARAVLALAWIAALVAVAAVPAGSLSYSLGLSPQIRTMFVSFQVALIAAGASLVLGLLWLWLARASLVGRRRLLLAVVPFGAALVILGLLVSRWDQARASARIHDVTTDMENPPAFETLLAERKATGRNPSEYDPKAAPLQQAAYPDIKPVILDRSTDVAFDRALAAVKAMGWEVASADKARGRIEATATTPWFRFKDDVVIRIAEAGAGRSRIDVRSVSRIGGGDLGQNAERVRAYVARLAG